MVTARLIDNIWATRKSELLNGYKLMLVEIIGGIEAGKRLVAADVISAVSGTRINYWGKEDNVDMCLAVEEIMIEGAIHAFKKLNISQGKIVQYIMEEYDKSEEEAEKLIRECEQ